MSVDDLTKRVIIIGIRDILDEIEKNETTRSDLEELTNYLYLLKRNYIHSGAALVEHAKKMNVGE